MEDILETKDSVSFNLASCNGMIPYFLLAFFCRRVTTATQIFFGEQAIKLYVHIILIATTLLETNIFPFRGFLLKMIGSFSHIGIFIYIPYMFNYLYLNIDISTKIFAISSPEVKKSNTFFV